MTKYLKPKSLTWLASFFTLCAGLFLQLAGEVPAMAEWVAAVSAIYGGAAPGVLITAGLTGIGLRAAVADAEIKATQASNQNSIGD